MISFLVTNSVQLGFITSFSDKDFIHVSCRCSLLVEINDSRKNQTFILALKVFFTSLFTDQKFPDLFSFFVRARILKLLFSAFVSTSPNVCNCCPSILLHGTQWETCEYLVPKRYATGHIRAVLGRLFKTFESLTSCILPQHRWGQWILTSTFVRIMTIL